MNGRNLVIISGVVKAFEVDGDTGMFTLMFNQGYETKAGVKHESIIPYPVAVKGYVLEQAVKQGIANDETVIVEGSLLTRLKEETGKKTYKAWIIAAKIDRP